MDGVRYLTEKRCQIFQKKTVWGCGADEERFIFLGSVTVLIQPLRLKAVSLPLQSTIDPTMDYPMERRWLRFIEQQFGRGPKAQVNWGGAGSFTRRQGLFIYFLQWL